jgi:putative exporter of polyketide antibiotics
MQVKKLSLSISYIVEDAGWAQITISDGEGEIVNDVSYLHDSLRDLAELAIEMRSGAKTAKAIFMDEPGELQLVVSRVMVISGVWKQVEGVAYPVG